MFYFVVDSVGFNMGMYRNIGRFDKELRQIETDFPGKSGPGDACKKQLSQLWLGATRRRSLAEP
eukprot:7783210-Pyramimonas_sp.AAC.1